MEASAPVIVDSGVLVALLDARDQHHAWARASLEDLGGSLSTCDAVVSETCFLIGLRPRVLRRLDGWFNHGEIRVEYESQNMVGHAFALMDAYSNVPMSYADACLVCMVEARPRARVFTLDSDFRIYRQRNRRVIPLIAPFA